jgi:hypothetical protein
MNKEFFKNITSAFHSAGWLMIGTGLIITVLNMTSIGITSIVKQWGYGSLVVGACFVVIDLIASYLLRD